MAKSNAVWGIDIGQCALKALRCVPSGDANTITADAFDFIEYPKILSQPEADPVELVHDAIVQFLSRNKVKDDQVAISVPGQAGLARFIKLPPVESKKIPDIVRYEARQQIPFALEDVVFDWQQMAGGSEEDGFSLETEVGLFAMKREQVFRALRPFTEASIEVDLIQLTPLALYNFVVFDQMQDMPAVDSFDPKDPPPSTIVVSLGTDTTDLVITNGYRVWQRNIPLGGNHFTKALTKELKLTFAKAEHLKRNALKAEDPKAVFLAMRPVFNDLVTEVQRSISFFQSVDRTAKIGRVIPLGNAMKLRGLQKFLGQSLGYEVVELKEYRGLVGPGVVGTPAFKENLLSFGVCYGLALQGLRQATLRTNLIPPEIIKDRLIRAKKPWAVAGVAALLLGCTAGFFGAWRAYDSSRDTPEMKRALEEANRAIQTVETHKKDYDDAKAQFATVRETANRLANINDRRALWPEILNAVSQCVPPGPSIDADPKGMPLDKFVDQVTQQVEKSPRIYIDSIDCEFYSKLEDWLAEVKGAESQSTSGAATDTPAATQGPAAAPADSAAAAPATDAPGSTAGAVSGEGFVIQLRGHHYHNNKAYGRIAGKYVEDSLMQNLKTAKVNLPGPDGKPIPVTMKELGVGNPVLVEISRPKEEMIPLPGYDSKQAENIPEVKPERFDFTVEFYWKETPLAMRLKNGDEQKKSAEQKAPSLAAGSSTTPTAAPQAN